MTTLTTFHALVSTEINRGTKFDSEIGNFVRNAAKFVESNHTLEYMKKFDATVDIAEDVRTVPISTLTSNEIKKILFWRIVNSDATFSYIEKIEAEDLMTRADGKPSNFWIDGKTNFILGSTPDQAYADTEFGWVEYTAWPTATALGDEPWLVTNAESLMKAQTMLEMKTRLRLSATRKAEYKEARDEALKVLLDAQKELDEGAAVEQMAFG